MEDLRTVGLSGCGLANSELSNGRLSNCGLIFGIVFQNKTTLLIKAASKTMDLMRPLICSIFFLVLTNPPCPAQDRLPNFKVETIEMRPMTEVNSDHLDFSPVYFDNGIVFVSNRGINEDFIKQKDHLTGENCTSLFFTALQPDGSGGPPVLFSKSLTSSFHDGPAAFSKDGRQIYFTSSSQVQQKRETGKMLVRKRNELNLKIFFSERIGGDWTAPKLFDLGGESTDVHPTLSADGQRMVFASDRPGGFGGMDLYVSHLKEGKWSAPVNLGSNVNTPGDDVFPFLYGNSTLFFASDGRGGWGGLDVFQSVQNESQQWDLAENLGAPINSEKDDFGFVTNEAAMEGILSSNRRGGTGGDDLYYFVVKQPKASAERQLVADTQVPQQPGNPSDCTDLTGRILQRDTERPVALANLTLVNLSNGSFKTANTDESGHYSICADSGYDFILRADALGFNQTDKLISTAGMDLTSGENGGPMSLDFTMVPSADANIGLLAADETYQEMLEEGFFVEMGGIYYGFDEFMLQPGAMDELDKVIEFMRRQPNLHVEIRSHTDSRGDADYNRQLSAKRAQAVAGYLVSKGIDSGQVSARGFGEDQLVNACGDGIPCSEAAHRMNRRTALRIFKP